VKCAVHLMVRLKVSCSKHQPGGSAMCCRSPPISDYALCVVIEVRRDTVSRVVSRCSRCATPACLAAALVVDHASGCCALAFVGRGAGRGSLCLDRVRCSSPSVMDFVPVRAQLAGCCCVRDPHDACPSSHTALSALECKWSLLRAESVPCTPSLSLISARAHAAD